ncbi:uncharacterized protein LOC132255564 [Phlebotomus argentipes]|uniref:30 kDa salivary protein SP15 n=1 Tax=Phlebotomus argentipes TaxID=94469 RepID=Q0ZST5_PHLAR|nr:uncharacterized protein LOC132255564 [Phlebotomus argentipes]ABA12146.1 30 kDa salivary protein SP15 [Phlebotomus argentipes]
MASVTGYCVLLLLSSCLVLGSIQINNNFGDFPKLLAFLGNAIKSEKSPDGLLYERYRLTIDVDKVIINKISSILKKSEVIKDKELLRTGVFIVKNTGNSQVEAQSQSYMYKKIHTDSISIANTKGLTGAIKIPMIDHFGPTVTFSNTKTTSQIDTTEEWVTVPPQKVQLKPKTQMKVKYNLYREELVQKYNLDFLVARNSTFIVTRGLSYAFSGIERIRQDKLYLLRFIRLMHLKGKKFNDSKSIEYDFKNKRLLIKDYVVTRKVVKDIVEVSFGDEEPVEQ